MGIVPADVDLAMFAPDAYGSGPTATAMPAILNVLEELQHEGVLAGLLDLQHIVIGGHSAGGRAAVRKRQYPVLPTGGGGLWLWRPHGRRHSVGLWAENDSAPAG